MPAGRSQTKTRTNQPVRRAPFRLSPAWVTALLLIFLVVLAIAQDQPPSALPASAPKTEFSAARALEDVRAIAQKPHPTGTPENERARLYIVKELIKLGLEPRVHVTSITYADPRWGTPFPGATVQNIVAKLKGKT